MNGSNKNQFSLPGPMKLNPKLRINLPLNDPFKRKNFHQMVNKALSPPLRVCRQPVMIGSMLEK